MRVMSFFILFNLSCHSFYVGFHSPNVSCHSRDVGFHFCDVELDGGHAVSDCRQIRPGGNAAIFANCAFDSLAVSSMSRLVLVRSRG